MLPAPHLDRLRTQLAQLPELIVRAHLALQPGAGRRGARVSGATRTAPLPCRADVLSLIGPTATATVHDDHGDQDDAPGLNLLASWARTVLEDRQAANDWTAWVRPVGYDWERTASRAVKVLLLHLDFAAGRPYARDLADEIGRLHGHLNRATGQPIAPPIRPRMVCPGCQLMTAAVQDDGRCECRACGLILTGPEYVGRVVQAELAAA
ncbi:hypothetical protein ACIQC7_27830 [Kitasatospora sp. NPDC088556]|uniref:hypothetical protein n=1 Tax=Kitasatospora sp. NPDC088556 TaxID=3364076 RepID=UPI00381700ED